MNRLIGRPGRLLLPAAIGLCAAAGAGERAAALALAVIITRICSLCAGEALRAAAARTVNSARMNGNFYLALIMGALGGAPAWIICRAPFSPICGHIPPEALLAGMAVNIAQLAADGIYILPDAKSGGAADAIIALFTAAGLLVSGGNGYLLAATEAICMLAVLAAGLMLRPKLTCRPGARVLACAPGALLRMGVPCALMAFMLYMHPDQAAVFCMAWGIFDAMEAPIRRSAEEGCCLTLTAAVAGAAAALAAAIFPGVLTAHIAMAALVTSGALLIFSAPIGPRTLAILTALGAALWAGWKCAAAPEQLVFWSAVTLSAAALGAAVPDAMNATRRIRAGRIMRKRRR